MPALKRLFLCISSQCLILKMHHSAVFRFYVPYPFLTICKRLLNAIIKAFYTDAQNGKNVPFGAVFSFIILGAKSDDFLPFPGHLQPKKPGFNPFSGLSRFFQLPGASFLILHTNSQQAYRCAQRFCSVRRAAAPYRLFSLWLAARSLSPGRPHRHAARRPPHPRT